MCDLITDLLESERLASPHAALHREPLDLAALIGEVVAEFNDAVEVRQELTIELPTLKLDRSRMRLLLRNLIENALRHSVQPLRVPFIRVQPVPSGGVCISVRDFWHGVPDDQIENLAQPFYRPDAARERTTVGVGLGLYLCKLVALVHGGCLRSSTRIPVLRLL
jgi:signal transduction histidine kinase